MKKLILSLVVVLLVVGGLAYVLRRPITMALVPRVIQRNFGTNLINELPDGLHVALCGAGSPLPDPVRSGPCVAVIAGQQLFIVDAGTGGSRNLGRMRLPQGEIDGVLLTHFHSDHIDGLGEVLLQRWIGAGHSLPTPVYGPEGVQDVVAGFNLAYKHDARSRTEHHGTDIAPPSGAGATARPFDVPAPGEGVKLVDDGDVAVTAFVVDHDPVRPAVGYRFDYKDRSLVVSGDTDKSENVLTFSKGADLLVHEALSEELVQAITEGAKNAGNDRIATITHDILDYHASPREAAEVARDAGVQALLYYHIVPPLVIPTMNEVFLEGVSDIYDGPITLGKDGTFVSLPAGSKEISQQELL